MAKVGRFVTDPRAGSYCHITLDSGEKIVVHHGKQQLSIEVSKLLGFSSDRIFVCDLETPAGRAVLATLTRDATPGTAAATPLGALVHYVDACGTTADVKTRCAPLLRGQ